jgi:hypothetical protein
LLRQIYYSFKTWFIVGILSFQKWFDVDVLAFSWLGDCLGYFLKNWAFFKSSGHPVQHLEQE